jgi:hypothetical protein
VKEVVYTGHTIFGQTTSEPGVQPTEEVIQPKLGAQKHHSHSILSSFCFFPSRPHFFFLEQMVKIVPLMVLGQTCLSFIATPVRKEAPFFLV